jgi:hypothetical protein
MSVWLVTVILFLETPALTQEVSQIYDTQNLGDRGDVAIEMGDLYESTNKILNETDLNVKRELWMIYTDRNTILPHVEKYANSISLWQKKSQDLSYNIYNPMMSHGANITTFFDFTDNMNGFIFDYSLNYQLNMHDLKTVDNWSFCKNYKNKICQCFPLYFPPTEEGGTCISREIPSLELQYCLEKNAAGNCEMCKPGFMLINLNVAKPYCSSTDYCGQDVITGKEDPVDHGCLSCAMDHCVTCKSGWYKQRKS